MISDYCLTLVVSWNAKCQNEEIRPMMTVKNTAQYHGFCCFAAGDQSFFMIILNFIWNSKWKMWYWLVVSAFSQPTCSNFTRDPQPTFGKRRPWLCVVTADRRLGRKPRKEKIPCSVCSEPAYCGSLRAINCVDKCFKCVTCSYVKTQL